VPAPEVPPDPDPDPVPEVPPLLVPPVVGALAPPELGAVPTPEPLVELEDGAEEASADDALEELVAVVPVAPVAPVAPVTPVAAETAFVGTVIGGAPEVSAEVEPPLPQAATPRARSPAPSSVRIRDLAGIGRTSGTVRNRVVPCAGRSEGSRSDPSG
jgi:hypothetical protein